MIMNDSDKIMKTMMKMMMMMMMMMIMTMMKKNFFYEIRSSEANKANQVTMPEYEWQ